MANKMMRCREILDEYEVLKARIEALELGEKVSVGELAESGITADDLKRLEEIEKELDSSCRDIMPKYDRVDIPQENGYFSNSRG
jgi:hypothetical protein